MKKNNFLHLFRVMILLVIWQWGNAQEKTTDFSPWKFNTGNSPAWQNPGFDDSAWKTIHVNQSWESQGYGGYDGMGCYRSFITIPSSFKNDPLAEGIWLYLGYIDDRDSVFLNGNLIATGKFWKSPRNYFLSCEDPNIQWDRRNTLVVKVMDDGGGGGMYSGIPYITASRPIDFIELNTANGDFAVSEKGDVHRTFEIKSSSKYPIAGTLVVTATDMLNDQVIYSDKEKIKLAANGKYDYNLNFRRKISGSCKVQYQFTEDVTQASTQRSEDVPYILTPPVSKSPLINGPEVYGVRPGNPVLYKIPVTGERPIVFAVENLPDGLELDTETGIISGKIARRGNYELKIHAGNPKGKDTRNFTIKVGDQIALTPPLGWNSWNCWGLSIDEDKVKAAARSFISSGLADLGWSYINIDDGWEAGSRDDHGVLHANSKFKDMTGLADYVHQLGLKIGIYSSPGPFTCGGYLGSYQHEKTDVETWTNWGIDYVKYDWCSYSGIVPDPDLNGLKAPYADLFAYLKIQPRDIVFSLCQYGMGDVWKWGGSVGGNLWRTTGDIEDTWESMAGIGFHQSDQSPYARPGNWNDPDMLVVGKLGWGDVRNNRLTPDEQYTHISLWALLKAPLLIGCDLTRLDKFTLNLLCNREVLAINQDALGKQADKIYEADNIQVYLAQLADGNYAVGVFNLNEVSRSVAFDQKMLGIDGRFVVRDVWRQQDEGKLDAPFKVKLAPHGTQLFVLKRN